MGWANNCKWTPPSPNCHSLFFLSIYLIINIILNNWVWQTSGIRPCISFFQFLYHHSLMGNLYLQQFQLFSCQEFLQLHVSFWIFLMYLRHLLDNMKVLTIFHFWPDVIKTRVFKKITQPILLIRPVFWGFHCFLKIITYLFIPLFVKCSYSIV